MAVMSWQDNRKCFTFIWTLENVSYYSQIKNESIRSPTFVINELQESKYHLDLYLGGQSDENFIDFHLRGEEQRPSVIIECELALLSKEGSVLLSQRREQCDIFPDFCKFKEIKDLFSTDKSTYLPEDKLRVRCRVWGNSREMTENVQCFARSRIYIQKQSVLWKIRNFSSIQSEEKCTFQIRSVQNKKLLMTLDLFIKNPYTDEDSINIQLVAGDGNIKCFVLQLMPLNVFSSSNESIRKEFLFSHEKKPKLFTLPFSKKDLMTKKNLFLPDDILTLRFECQFSTGYIFEEIENVIYSGENLASIEQEKRSFEEKNTLSVAKRILNENLKSLFHESILPDITLKTSSKTYPAHKSVLSARSPVFKAMLSNDMKEKISKCVDIDDLDSDAVYQMLHYVYTAEMPDLQWENACELYRAADKYEILALRDECASCLKSKLCPTNACDVLIFADTYKDDDLKTSVQDFIFEHDLINSDKWEQLMETHLKLAADTMRLQIQRKPLRNKCFTSTQGFDGNPTTKLFDTPALDFSTPPSFHFGNSLHHGPFQFDFGTTPATDEFSGSAPRRIRKVIRRVPREK